MILWLQSWGLWLVWREGGVIMVIVVNCRDWLITRQPDCIKSFKNWFRQPRGAQRQCRKQLRILLSYWGRVPECGLECLHTHMWLNLNMWPKLNTLTPKTYPGCHSQWHAWNWVPAARFRAFRGIALLPPRAIEWTSPAPHSCRLRHPTNVYNISRLPLRGSGILEWGENKCIVVVSGKEGRWEPVSRYGICYRVRGGRATQ